MQDNYIAHSVQAQSPVSNHSQSAARGIPFTATTAYHASLLVLLRPSGESPLHVNWHLIKQDHFLHMHPHPESLVQCHNEAAFDTWLS